MHRFYIAPENWNPDSLVLGGPEAHHARDVLRLQPGGCVVVFNGRGHEITAEIAPLISERTIVHLEAKEAAQKQAKWQQVAIEAAKQSGQNWLPAVQTPRKLSDFFANAGLQRLRLIGSLQSDAMHLKAVLADYEREHHARPASVLMCIGPEGDFTPAELNLARSNGCRPITLGPIILRVETAAIYCLSVLSYELLAKPSGTQV